MDGTGQRSKRIDMSEKEQNTIDQPSQERRGLRLVGTRSRKRNVALLGERRRKRGSHLKKPRESKENADEGLLLILKSSQNRKDSQQKRKG
jgi:hypothetical protein